MSQPVDIIVIGAGAAGMTAASVAAAEGRRVLLLEHAAVVGGTTAISGGMVWVAANHKMAEAGLPDSVDDARSYLEATVPAAAYSRPLAAFLEHGASAIRYLEARTSVRLQAVKVYPDYYQAAPGATRGGRVLEPVPFDGSTLGPAFELLRPPLPEFTLFGGMMISRYDIPHLRRMWRSPRSALRVAQLLARYARERIHARRGTSLYLGNALAARLLKSALDLGVVVQTGSRVLRLLVNGRGVHGVEYERAGKPVQAFATKAVILACGGISFDPRLRPRHVPPIAGTLSATVKSGADRSGAALALSVGGQLSPEPLRQGYWGPGSKFTRRNGTAAVFPHTVTDRGKPGTIAVDQTGRRFVNECLSYHEFVLGQLKTGPQAIPAFLVCDSRFLWKYGLGAIKPFTLFNRRLLQSGYLKRGRTIGELAIAIGVPSDALENTLSTFNRDASVGIDSAFGRGSDAYQRHMGDADHAPNPCVAPIDRPPYYAVALWPADLGMAAGLVTDESARVLGSDGKPIGGLYAAGNDMQSVMNGAYPGPGITLGPALVFGFIAARHAAALPSAAAIDRSAHIRQRTPQ